MQTKRYSRTATGIAWAFGRYVLWGAVLYQLLIAPALLQFILIPLWIVGLLWWFLDRRIRPGARVARAACRHAAMLQARAPKIAWWRIVAAGLLWGVATPFTWSALTGACSFSQLPVAAGGFQAVVPTGLGGVADVALASLRLVPFPLIEEFTFRGWLLFAFRRAGASAITAVLGTSLLFAIAHLDPYGLHYHVFAGLMTGFAVISTKSIWAGVAVHFVHNVAVAISRSTMFRPIQDGLMESRLWHCDASFVVAALASTGFFLLLWRKSSVTTPRCKPCERAGRQRIRWGPARHVDRRSHWSSGPRIQGRRSDNRLSPLCLMLTSKCR